MSYSLKEFGERLRKFHYVYAPIHQLRRLVKHTSSGKPLPMPKLIFVEPTNACNYKCPKCPQSGGLCRPAATLDIELFKQLVAELKPFRPSLALHHSGEPMLHPRIFDLIRIAREAGLFTIMVTNASLLHRDDYRIVQEGPDALGLSVDGASPGAYEPSHGGASWEKIKGNIEGYFSRWDSGSPSRHVYIAMIRDSQTQAEVQEYHDFARRFPFFATLIEPTFVWPDGQGVAPVPAVPPGHWSYPCRHPWLSPAMLADGTVVPCCLDAHGLYPAGNFKEAPFLKIFRGEKLDQVRRHLIDLEGTPPLALCDSCGIKRQSVFFSRRRWIVFNTMPAWKLLFRNLLNPIGA